MMNKKIYYINKNNIIHIGLRDIPDLLFSYYSSLQVDGAKKASELINTYMESNL